jgi:hypothetical protein
MPRDSAKHMNGKLFRARVEWLDGNRKVGGAQSSWFRRRIRCNPGHKLPSEGRVPQGSIFFLQQIEDSPRQMSALFPGLYLAERSGNWEKLKAETPEAIS